MLSIMAIAGALADVIQLPGIVGAFLAGLAINASAQHAPASAKLDFLAKSLFIPIFFVVTGFLIDPVTFVHGIFDNFLLVASIIGALLLGKWLAAWGVGRARMNSSRSGRSRCHKLPPRLLRRWSHMILFVMRCERR